MKGWYTALCLVLAVLTLTACAQHTGQTTAGQTVEVTETDVVPLMFNGTLNSTQVSVNGVELGDAKQEVTAELGAPSNFTNFGDVMNYEYDRGNDTAIIIHLVNDSVERITLHAAFNPELHGKTTVNETKSGIYRDFGLPESKDIVFRYILFEYEDEGVEVITFRGDEFGLSFLPPGKVSESLQKPAFKERIPFGGEVKIQ